MTAAALVLAGGAGDRMRAAGVAKPLVEVRGVTLLERNVHALIGAGIRAIWIAHRAGQADIAAAVDRLAAAAGRRGVAIAAIAEAEPLGTIGAAGRLRDRADPLLTVNADNLTAIDLAAVVARHVAAGADLTLATHDHVTRLAYGALDTDGDRVTAYREKPALVTPIASAVCVLGPRALAAITGRLGLHELATRLIDAGAHVIADHHAAAWIDVNTPADVARAAELVTADPDRLECWARPPELEVAGAVIRAGDADDILLERRRDGRWDTPGGKLEPGEAPAAAMARELDEELGLRVAPGPALTRFDTLEPDGVAVRHHVFAVTIERAAARAREGQTIEWFPRAALPPARSAVVVRSLAAAEAAP
jgi:NDP-mannose synthase